MTLILHYSTFLEILVWHKVISRWECEMLQALRKVDVLLFNTILERYRKLYD